MAVYNLGSINVDHVYTLDRLPRPTETLSAESKAIHLGGKGLNISVALKNGGADVRHIGAIGADDQVVRGLLAPFDLDLTHVAEIDGPTGHAIIYVDAKAENQIVILPGTNGQITEAHIEAALAGAGPDDWLVMQNETNANAMGLAAARARGMKVALVAAPFTAEMPALMDQVDLVSVNQSELEAYEAAIGASFRSRTDMAFLITYGAKGAEYVGQGETHRVAAHKVDAVDTTGAGDTFFGGFMSQISQGRSIADALEFASAMAALQVQKHGAATAIPSREDVLNAEFT